VQNALRCAAALVGCHSTPGTATGYSMHGRVHVSRLIVEVPGPCKSVFQLESEEEVVLKVRGGVQAGVDLVL